MIIEMWGLGLVWELYGGMAGLGGLDMILRRPPHNQRGVPWGRRLAMAAFGRHLAQGKVKTSAGG